MDSFTGETSNTFGQEDEARYGKRTAYGACDTQMGRSAALRTYFPVGSQMRNDLNKIVHAADKNPHKYGENIFADKTCTYDPKAQVVIDNATQ